MRVMLREDIPMQEGGSVSGWRLIKRYDAGLVENILSGCTYNLTCMEYKSMAIGSAISGRSRGGTPSTLSLGVR